jgi:hypothetical protein
LSFVFDQTTFSGSNRHARRDLDCKYLWSYSNSKSQTIGSLQSMTIGVRKKIFTQDNPGFSNFQNFPNRHIIHRRIVFGVQRKNPLEFLKCFRQYDHCN